VRFKQGVNANSASKILGWPFAGRLGATSFDVHFLIPSLDAIWVAVPIVEIGHLAPALSIGMVFLRSKVSLDAFWWSVGELLAQSNLRFLLNKNPAACKKPESLFIALASFYES
jgi:hypothetical protein